MKRFLAIALALVMIFCLAACGENKGNDTTTAKPTTAPDGNNGGGLTSIEIPDFKVGMSVADIDALLAMFVGADMGLDIEDLYLEFGHAGGNTLMSMGANLLNQDYDINVYTGENIVISAPALLDKNYGISLQGMTELMNGLTSSMTPDMGGSVVGGVANIDTEAAAQLLVKYIPFILDEIKSADGISVTEKGGNTVITGKLDVDAVSEILVNVLEELCKDDNFFAVMGSIQGVSAEEFKQSFLAGKPDKATLLSTLKQSLAYTNLEIKLNNVTLDSDSLPVAVDIEVSLNQDAQGGNRPAYIALAYDLNKGTCSATFKDNGVELFSMEMGDSKFEMSMNVDGVTVRYSMAATSNGFSGYMEQNGQKIMEIALTVTDNSVSFKLNIRGSEILLNAQVSGNTAEGTLSMDGTEVAKVTFDKAVQGNRTSFTLKSITVQGQSIDFSAAGICFYLETDPEIAAAPDFVDISTLDETQLQEILVNFATDNADLIEWISQFMGGNDSDYTEPDYDIYG